MLCFRAMHTQSVGTVSPQSQKSTENLDFASVRISSKPSSPHQWQKRERILALSEKKTASGTKSASAAKGSGGGRFLLRASASTSSTTSSAVIIAQPSHVQHVPRMGLRVNEKKVGRHTSTCNSEQSLPEKLTYALKALRPSAFSHSSSTSSPLKSKSSSFVVATDDLVYYPGSDHVPNKRFSVNVAHMNQQKTKVGLTKTSPSQNDLHQVTELSSLEQIKQLYKSVPNISAIDDPRPVTAPVARRSACRPKNESRFAGNRSENRGSSPFLAKSPTDSGYRSAPRHLNSLREKIAGVARREHFPKSPEKHHENIEPTHINEENPSEGPVLHEPTIVLINGEGSDAAVSPQVHHGFATSSSKGCDHLHSQNHDEHHCSREIMYSSAESKSEATYDTLSISARFNDVPFDEKDIITVLKRGRCKEYGDLINVTVIPRLAAYLDTPLRKLANEIKRLSAPLTKCTLLDIKTAVKVVLSESVADSCVKAGVQATSIYALSGTGALKISMSRRAGLHFNLGRFYRWMIESRISRAVSDGAAVYLCAVMECLLEETVRTCITNRGGNEMLTARSFDEVMKEKEDLCQLFASLERTRRGARCSSSKDECTAASTDGSVCVRDEADLRNLIQTLPYDSTMNGSGGNENQKALQCSFTKEGLTALLYYMQCSGHCEKKAYFETRPTSQKRLRLPLLYEWLRVVTAFAAHRRSQFIDEEDVRQAARILLPNADCPPRGISLHVENVLLFASKAEKSVIKRELGFLVLQAGNSELIEEALTLLGPLSYRATSEFGLTALAQAVVMGNDKAISLLLSVGADVNTPVPAEAPSKASSSTVLSDFAGWTPLTWAVAREDTNLVRRLIEACSDVENSFMVRETPLQLAAMLNNFDIIVLLINNGANPFHTSISYDSLKCNFRNTGSPSALALAAAHGHRRILRAMILTATNSKKVDEHISLKDFLEESDDARDTSSSGSSETNARHSSMFLNGFNKEQQRALQEAIYYAAETGHLEVALDLRKIGVPWNVYTWATCLRLAGEQKLRSTVNHLLGDFNSRLSDEISHETIDGVVSELFEILRAECTLPDGDPTPVASIISRLFKQFRFGAASDETAELPQQQSIIHRPAIDLKYVDNAELSDIRFLVEKRIIHAHRIVLVNSSDVFKRLLDSPKGQIEIDNISYEVFKLLMQCLYSGNYSSTLSNRPLRQQMDLIEAARRFAINALIAESRGAIRPQISRQTVIDIYKFVMGCSLGPLIVDCEMYILEHLSSLINNPRLKTLLERSGQSGWPDYGAGLASRLTTAFEERCSRISLKS
uniref:Ankyrin repeat and BTB/POZ domain-containing protein 2 n=1 Tax=Ascaris suum TaxID=6253 RepID=F1KQV6_ASCSU